MNDWKTSEWVKFTITDDNEFLFRHILNHEDYDNNLMDLELMPLRSICLQIFIKLTDRIDMDDSLKLPYVVSIGGMTKEELEGNLRFFRGCLITRLIEILNSQVYRTDSSVSEICDSLERLLGS